MRGISIFGLILIAAGIAGLFYRYIPYTQTQSVVDVRPVQIDKVVEKRLPIPELAPLAAVLAGLGLVFVGRRSAS